MSELPNGWAATKLGDTLTLNYGKSLPATKRDGGEFPVYGSNGIVGQHSEAITGEPAIVVGRKGSFGEVHYCDGRCFPIDTTYFVDGFDATDPRFAFHLLRHLPLTEMNRASAIPGLNREDAYSLAIGLPPLPEQRRIVAKVDGLTARTARARKELDRIPTLIARYKQRFLTLAFSGDLTADWRKAERALEAREVQLAEVAESFKYGSSAKSAKKGKVPVLRMGNIQDGKLDWAKLAFTSVPTEIEKYKLVAGDVLFNRTNSPELVGKTALYKGEREAIYAGYLIKVTCGPLLMPEFLTYCLNSPLGRSYCWQVKSDGVSQSNINAKKLAAFSFLLPSLAEQAEIVRRIDFAFDWLDRITIDHIAAARLLPKLDAAILAKAFRGELVPQDPNDEPAAALLEKMRSENRAKVVKQKSVVRSRPRKSVHMKQHTKITTVMETLKTAGSALSGQALLEKSGYPRDVSSEQIESFFLDVRQALDEKAISRSRVDNQDYFSLIVQD